MKSNKILALTLLIASSLFTVSELQAANSTTPPKEVKPNVRAGGAHVRRGVETYEQLGLSDDQKAKMKAAMDEMQKQSQALREDTTVKLEEKRAKYMELHKAKQAKVKEILTPEQFEKFQKQMEQNREQRQPMRPDNRVRGAVE